MKRTVHVANDALLAQRIMCASKKVPASLDQAIMVTTSMPYSLRRIHGAHYTGSTQRQHGRRVTVVAAELQRKTSCSYVSWQ